MQLFNIFLFWLFFGLLASHFAKKRGRRPLVWFFLGLFLGIISIGMLLLLPKPTQRSSSQRPAPALVPLKKSDSWLKLWYYMDPTHNQQGPLEFPDLIKKWKERGLSERSYIWGEGMPEWRRLSDLPDLIQEIEQAH